MEEWADVLWRDGVGDLAVRAGVTVCSGHGGDVAARWSVLLDTRLVLTGGEDRSVLIGRHDVNHHPAEARVNPVADCHVEQVLIAPDQMYGVEHWYYTCNNECVIQVANN